MLATREAHAIGMTSLTRLANSSSDSSGKAGISSPLVVRVEKLYSASVDPASFVAVRNSVYHLAGSKSVIIKLPASGRTWLERRMNSLCVLGLYCTTKYWIGHPELLHALRLTTTNDELLWIRSRADGAIGAARSQDEVRGRDMRRAYSYRSRLFWRK